jgi:hypothetical protein
MTLFNVLIIFIVLILTIFYYINGHLKTRYLNQYIPEDLRLKNGETIALEFATYRIFYVYAPVGSVVTINSPTFIEIKKGKKAELLSTINLKEPHLIIVYPTKEKMLKVINENEVKFLLPFEQVYQSYIIYAHDIEAFLKEHQ